MKNVSAEVRNMIWVSVGFFALALAMAVYAWVVLPPGSQVPIHWNAAGQIDDYADKTFGLLFIPLMILGLSAMFAVIPRIDPHGDNILRSWKAYRVVWLGTLILMVLIQAITVFTALGRLFNVGLLIPAFVGVFFIAIGNAMGKVRPNFFFGVRTPWTLSSDVSWNKTHRLAGWIFVGLGALMIVGSAFGSGEWWVWVLLAGIFGMLVAVTWYSYHVWKEDPDRRKAVFTSKDLTEEKEEGE